MKIEFKMQCCKSAVCESARNVVSLVIISASIASAWISCMAGAAQTAEPAPSAPATVEVEANGRAAGEPGKAREMALADAFREAIQRGAGVDIMSKTGVSNFTLDYDQVITSSFGYVDSYTVTKQKYDKDAGIYTLTIKAMVSKGKPGMGDTLALRLLNRRMESPRVIIETEEKYTGIDSNTSTPFQLAKGVLEELAKQYGLQVLESEAILKRDSKDAARLELLGDISDAKVKQTGVASISDLTIKAIISGGVGKEYIHNYGYAARDASIGIDIKAFWGDSSEIAAACALPTSKPASYQSNNPEQIARKAIIDTLKGKEGGRFFNMLLAKWVVELDLGAKILVSIKKISKPNIERLVEKLNNTDGISYVWLREFDARMGSTIELETRLTSEQLSEQLPKILNDAFDVDRITKRRVEMRPSALAAQSSPLVQAIPAAPTAPAQPVIPAAAPSAQAPIPPPHPPATPAAIPQPIVPAAAPSALSSIPIPALPAPSAPIPQPTPQPANKENSGGGQSMAMTLSAGLAVGIGFASVFIWLRRGKH